jgi:hypothetical protein
MDSSRDLKNLRWVHGCSCQTVEVFDLRVFEANFPGKADAMRSRFESAKNADKPWEAVCA